MKEVDYIVVGLGIAGLAFCERLRQEGKSFVVFEASFTCATKTAGGVVNPVVLKRFTPIWNLSQFHAEAYPFYHQISKRLEVDFLQNVSLQRVFNNVKEQNDWLVASDKTNLATFLSSELIKNDNPFIEAPFGFGKVNEVFKIDTLLLIEAYSEDLLRKEQLISEKFDYELIKLDQGVSSETDVNESHSIQYKNYKAGKIIFSEGAAAVNNPYFNIDCLIPKKGEYIVFKAPQLRLKSILKGSIFIIPLRNDLYKAGATFDHDSRTPEITMEGETQLVASVRKLIHCPFEIVDQMAGMRPTVKDRRPLLGSIAHKQLLFFNGLGTRGLGMAPLLSKQLYDFVEGQTPLPDDVNIQRFVK
ncbi:MAG: FAD-binding oxidoreductase [Flavobacteriaceae bacterium]|nr:FAD-binding oxidoreductase [Flavobacteriaceae bacterium]